MLSFRARFVALSILCTVILGFLIWLVSVRTSVEQAKLRLINNGRQIGYLLAAEATFGVLVKNRNILDSLVENASQNEDISVITICDKEGRIIASNVESKVSYVDAGVNTSSYEFIVKPISKSNYLELQFPIKLVTYVSDPKFDKKVGMPYQIIGFVHIILSLQGLNVIGRQITFKVLFAVLGILAPGAFVLHFMCGLMLAPLRRMIEMATSIADGTPSKPLHIRTKDEVEELAEALNDMADAVYEAQDALKKQAGYLEKMVRQRTKDIEDVNKRLRDKQAQLIQSAKLAELGQMGAAIAHELNNPLQGILGYVQFTAEKMSTTSFTKKDISDCKKYLEYIEKETKRCKDIVQNLLTFSRKGEDYVELDLRKILEQTLALMRDQLEKTGVSIYPEYAEDVWSVEGNANQLMQVFMNMLRNAQQAISGPGFIYLGVKNNIKENVVEVEFKDNGCGISADDLPNIFDPFFTTKRDWKGVGLGLSVSYEIVKAHKGDVRVMSKVGEGTTFIIKFPPIK